MTRNRWILLAVAFALVIGFDAWYFMGREEEPQKTFEEEYVEESENSISSPERSTYLPRGALPKWQHPENWPLQRRTAPLEDALSPRLMARQIATPTATLPMLALEWPKLGAILWNPEEPRVLLDGAVRSLNERHLGFQIVEITTDSVLLRKGSASRHLRIDDVAAAPQNQLSSSTSASVDNDSLQENAP